MRPLRPRLFRCSIWFMARKSSELRVPTHGNYLSRCLKFIWMPLVNARFFAEFDNKTVMELNANGRAHGLRHTYEDGRLVEVSCVNSGNEVASAERSISVSPRRIQNYFLMRSDTWSCYRG